MPHKILLADNSSIILEVMNFGFEEEGFDITTINSRQELITLINTNKYDLIIIEDNLIKDNLIAKIKETENNTNSYIFVLSEDTNPISKRKMKKLGASGWIIKPFIPDKLIKTIKQFLAR